VNPSLHKVEASKRTETQKNIESFFANGGLNFLKQIEDDFDCAGLCDVPLFYVTKDVSLGSPTKECVESLFDEITEGMSALGAIALITGIFTIGGFFGTFALCTNQPLDYKNELD